MSKTSEKIVEKLSSFYEEPVHADKVPQGIAYNYMGYTDSYIQALDKFMDDDFPIYPDDLDWEDEVVMDAVKGMGEVLNHNFGIETKSKRVEELHTAMNLPIISAINANAHNVPLNGSVCIIGADRGQNLVQCENALKRRPVDWNIVCIEPNKNNKVQERLARAVTMYPKAQIVDCTLSEVMGKRLLFKDNAPLKFDLIIHNLGMHVTCASAVERSMYVRFIDDHLSKHGKAICTSIDADAMRRSDDLGMQSPSRTVQLIHEYPSSDYYVDGMCLVRVGATYFRDPILPINKIYGMFHGEHLAVSVTPGKYLFRELRSRDSSYVPSFSVPTNLESAAKRPEVSLILYIEITRYEPQVGDLNLALTHSNSKYFETGVTDVTREVRWSQQPRGTSNELSRCIFSVNHGRPVIPTDLIFYNDSDYQIAPKRNGVAGRAAVYKGAGYMLLEDGRFFRTTGLIHSKLDVQLQVEVMEDGQVIVLDPYRIGIHSPTTFIDRWNLFMALYKISDVLRQLFVPQTYLPAHKKNYRIVRDYVEQHPHLADGIVLQNNWAMPGSFKNNLGSARYLKDKYTVDIIISGKVCEVPLDEFLSVDTHKRIEDLTVLKVRKDKTVPNTLMQISNIRSALKYKEWEDHMTLNQKELKITDIPTIILMLGNSGKIEDIPFEERVALYRGRFRDHKVVQQLVGEMTGSVSDVIYNCYMAIKEGVLIHMIAIHQQLIKLDEIKNLVIDAKCNRPRELIPILDD